ncbi:MAG: hypothetical protein RLZZ383_161 [Pseudomonadota bacterium]|jgi:flavin-dependent dehydrogenase
MTYDVVVVGAGPAGLAAAIRARQAGMTVAVRDPKLARSAGGIDKACGEGLMPAAVAHLCALGAGDLPHRPFVGISYIDGAHRAEARFVGAPGWGVQRTALSASLRAAAVRAGAVLLDEAVVEIARGPDAIRVDGVPCGWVIVADGLQSRHRAALGLDAGEPGSRRRVGVRQHFRVNDVPDTVEVHWGDALEAYVTPVDAQTVGVAVLGDAPMQGGPRARMHAAMAAFPGLAARLGPATDTLAGAGPFQHRATDVVAGRALLVGDAAGYVDALTGEGLKLAFEGAWSAVDAISAGDASRHRRTWGRAWRAYAWPTTALLTLTRPRWVRRALVPVLARLPGVMTAAVRQIAGPSV